MFSQPFYFYYGPLIADNFIYFCVKPPTHSARDRAFHQLFVMYGRSKRRGESMPSRHIRICTTTAAYCRECEERDWQYGYNGDGYAHPFTIFPSTQLLRILPIWIGHHVENGDRLRKWKLHCLLAIFGGSTHNGDNGKDIGDEEEKIAETPPATAIIA